MSDEFGMMGLASQRNQYLDGGYGMDCAQDTAAAVDKAVHDILDRCYKQAVEIITECREDMDKVVAYLLEKETITGAEMVAILEGRDPALADVTPEDRERQGIEAPARHISMVSQKIEAPAEIPEASGEAQTPPVSDASAPDSGTGEEGSAPPPSDP